MMSPQLAVALSVVALVGGGALGLWARPPAPEPPPEPSVETSTGPQVDACTEMADALGHDLSEVRQDLAGLALTLPMAEARARQHGALPAEWPDELADAFREPAMRRALGELAGSGLVALDCSEFPCVFAIIDHEPLEGDGTPGPETSPSYEALRALGCDAPMWTAQRSFDDDGSAHLTTLSSCGPTKDADVRARAAERVRQLAADLGAGR